MSENKILQLLTKALLTDETINEWIFANTLLLRDNPDVLTGAPKPRDTLTLWYIRNMPQYSY